ncbi:MAG: hypothetical protein MR355_04800 [Lachnospiraceae bacterium]|nr:hypothetical protein [Lachnospiraceae bacterium]
MSQESLLAYIKKLYGVKDDIQKQLQDKKETGTGADKMSGTDFEKVVYDSLIEAGFEKDSITHSAQKFPDFVLEDKEDGDKLGVEVKKTDSDKWEVIGGSIYESLKNDIDDTYIIMAKMGGEKPEVRLRKYEECIAGLKVTHSPRFYLNMDLEEGEDYLTKNDAKDLLELSGDELNRKIRKLLRTQKSTWWSEGETVAFSDLTKEEKGLYLNDGIALFPEVFKGDYRNFTPWLVYSCYVWCGNVRDIFSAGGNRFVDELGIYVSAVMYRALENVLSIRQRIIDMTDEEMQKFWGKVAENDTDRMSLWLSLVEENIRFSFELIQNNRKVSKFSNCDDAEMCLQIKNKYMHELEKRISME